MLRFTEDHEWLRIDGDVATVGITDHAQQQLGDLVFLELPKIGTALDKGAVAAVVESVKAASEVYAPIKGEVVAVNDKLTAKPGLVNSAPMSEGWLFKVKIADPAQFDLLIDEVAYQALIAQTDTHH